MSLRIFAGVLHLMVLIPEQDWEGGDAMFLFGAPKGDDPMAAAGVVHDHFMKRSE